MSLNLNQLEKVRELGNRIVQARCPACAEGGQDRTGEHLRIYPDGRFGCCVHPKDREHRKRIFALAGVKDRGTFTVRVKVVEPGSAVQSVKAGLSAFSVGTVKAEWKPNGKMASQASQESETKPAYGQSKYFGTPGTGLFELRACAREEVSKGTGDFLEKLKDWKPPVPSVPDTSVSATLDEARDSSPKERIPHFTPSGSLVIPFDGSEKFHWWKKGGQSLNATRAQFLAESHDLNREVYASTI